MPSYEKYESFRVIIMLLHLNKCQICGNNVAKVIVLIILFENVFLTFGI